MGRDLQCDVVIGPHTAQLVSEKLQPLAMVDVKGLRNSLQVFTFSTTTLTPSS
jgi:hypothetical protein